MGRGVDGGRGESMPARAGLARPSARPARRRGRLGEAEKQ
ncbi:hypothetical protein C7S16_6793 [Burkholderia thailandensis]|uniref:Uncharacterized protein n=1 Tax=Burkholderia thailandensis TaxID=57975 RepID=A0AAW9CZI1_BURTH|nr:hypothetical protein [Burkholderia thailandensis]MDW9253106.1 hypothetical protein [Burkholderia thailandensis]